MQNVNYNNGPSAAATNKQARLRSKLLLVAGPSILLSTVLAARKVLGLTHRKTIFSNDGRDTCFFNLFTSLYVISI